MNAPEHRRWCDRQAQPHASCTALVETIPLGTDVTLLVQLHQPAGTPPLVTLTTVRGPRRALVPVSLDRAGQLAAALDRAVSLAKYDPFDMN